MATDAKPAVAKAVVPKSISKSELQAELAEKTGLTKGQVKDAFEQLNVIIERELAQKGVFSFNALMKIVRVHKAAVAGGGERPNRFKPGEMIKIKDRPAKNIVRCRPLKALKDMV